MNNRQQNLLKKIISQYIKTAEPVSSKLISEKKNFSFSSATIRNEMAELEREGYICQPYISAGRIPTEKGYQFYVENFLSDTALRENEEAELKSILKSFKTFEPKLVKDIAKTIANFSSGTVFVAFEDNDFYYTGIYNLFSQPEFAEKEIIYSLSQVIDHLDSVVINIFDQIENDVEIFIGSQNPFSSDCSSIITKFNVKKKLGVLGLLGPTRMDYDNNVSLIKYCQDLINQI